MTYSSHAHRQDDRWGTIRRQSLSPAAAVVVIVLLSLGLWSAIWLAVTDLL
jgi:hypothetical protein